jgi:hypothetical protein
VCICLKYFCFLSDDDSDTESFASLDEDEDESSEDSSVDDSKLNVASSGNDGSHRRIYDKIQFCMYCSVGSTNLSKHQLRVHKNEDYIKQILSLPKKSIDRSRLLEKVRHMGNFSHNCLAIKEGEGVIIPVRRPANSSARARDYVPCLHCYGFFLKKHLYRHNKECKLRTVMTEPSRGLVARASMLLPSSCNASAGFKKNVLSTMLRDEVSILVRNDDIIMRFGEKYYSGTTHLSHLWTHCSEKMRELGRLVIAIRKIDGTVKYLTDCINPSKFLIVLQAVRQLCGWNESTNMYVTPSLAVKLGFSIKKCAMIVKSGAIIEDQTEIRRLADDFLYLCEAEWKDEINKAARNSLNVAKMNRPQLVPLTEDICLLHKFLEQKSQELMAEMSIAKADNKVWHELAKVTCVRLILFNRKRSGEAQRLLLNDYMKKNSNSFLSGDVLKSLSVLEGRLCQQLCRIEIRGKKGRTVPVILTKDFVKCIDVLNATRATIAGVNDSNPFVFARPYFQSMHCIRASDCLHDLAFQCEAKFPGNLTSTKLRKHIATTSQILNLTDSELDMLANFLGHDIRVHREYYRLPQETLQLAKVSKILLAFDKGEISKYKGKSLEEIDIDTDELVAMDSDVADDGDDEGNDDDVDDRNDSRDIEIGKGMQSYVICIV